jgi:hypothetical protein
MKKLFILILLLSSFLTACSNDEEGLPSITAHGANTFGCKVNGQVWVANGTDEWNPHPPLTRGLILLDTSKDGLSKEYKYYFEHGGLPGICFIQNQKLVTSS